MGHLQSFSQRGVDIPFEGKKLGRCRIREGDRTNLEYLLPAFSDDLGTYVIPMKELPNIIELSEHDYILHENLLTLRRVSPLAVRDKIEEFHIRGAAGEMKANLARKRRTSLETIDTMNYCFLIIQALREISPDTLNFDLSELITPTGHARAKAGFHTFATNNNTTASAVMEHLKTWSQIIRPIGMKLSQRPGFLGEDLARLQAMSIELKSYLEGQTSEAQQMGRTIIEASQRSSKIAFTEMTRIWNCETSIRRILNEPEPILQRINSRIVQISWILDGWQKLIDDWNNAKEREREDKRFVLKLLSDNLPQMPTELGIEDRRLSFSARRKTQGGQVRANIDWRTMRADTEMMQRLNSNRETVKK